MRYKYETHLHTSEASKCALASGAEQVRSYYDAGYSGIIVTDHFFNGNSCIPHDLTWNERIELFCRGYENAKIEGETLGMSVFFGWEQSYHGTDFLIYGLGKNWLIEHDDILEWSIEEQYKRVHADGGYVVHAHPFRQAFYIPETRLFPNCCDAVEVMNASNDNIDPEYNISAYEYADKYNFPMTGGSDVHNVPAMCGGMEFSKKLDSIEDYIEAVKSKSGKMLNFRGVN